MLTFQLQSQMPHFWSPRGTVDLESFRAVDVSRVLHMTQLQPFLCFLPCNCVSRKSSCPGCELPIGWPRPSGGTTVKRCFVSISIDLFVTCSLINSESFRSNSIHVMNSNLGSKQAWSNKMSSTVTKIKLDSRNQSNHSTLFPGLQIPLPAHFPITEK